MARIGPISRHGILIVKFANCLQREGWSKHTAGLAPILITIAAKVFGVVP